MDSDANFLIGCAMGIVAGWVIGALCFSRAYARVRRHAENLEDALYRERHRGMPSTPREEEWPEIIGG